MEGKEERKGLKIHVPASYATRKNLGGRVSILEGHRRDGDIHTMKKKREQRPDTLTLPRQQKNVGWKKRLLSFFVEKGRDGGRQLAAAAERSIEGAQNFSA